MRKSLALPAIAFVTAVAAVLRVAGADFGLPAIYNPDEVAIMNRTMALAPNRLNPGNFLYPSFYFYALFAWEGLLFVAGWLAGRFESLAAFEREFFADPSVHYYAGRLLSAVAGTLTVVVTWRFGRRLFGPIGGLSAAALMAVAPLAVRDAHYVKHDVPVTLLVVLTHVVLARLLLAPGHGVDAGTMTSQWWRWLAADGRRGWWLAGLLAGLSFSTHYYALFVFVPLVAAAMLPQTPGERLRARAMRTATTLLVAAAAFVAASPFLPLELETAWRDIVANRQIVVDRATTSGGLFASMGFYLSWLVRDASGTLAALLAIAGLLYVARTTDVRRVLLALGFPVAFILFMANTVPASRYLNPVLPFVAVLGGGAVAWLAAGGRGRRLAAAAALVAACLEAGTASVHTVRFFGRDDTRTLALRWFEEHVAPETSVLIQPYSVPLRQSRESLREALVEHLGSAGRASIRFQRQLALDPYPEPAYRTIFLGSGGLDVDRIYVDPAEFGRTGNLEPLRQLGVTHVVMKRYNVPDPVMTALEAALAREGSLEATFSPYRTDVSEAGQREVAPFLHNTDARIDPALERPGPIIDVWIID